MGECIGKVCATSVWVNRSIMYPATDGLNLRYFATAAMLRMRPSRCLCRMMRPRIGAGGFCVVFTLIARIVLLAINKHTDFNHPTTTDAYPTALSGLCGATFFSVSKLLACDSTVAEPAP